MPTPHCIGMTKLLDEGAGESFAALADALQNGDSGTRVEDGEYLVPNCGGGIMTLAFTNAEVVAREKARQERIQFARPD
jgi:hypothetical protein